MSGCLNQGFLDIASGDIAGMENPAHGMTAFATEVRGAVGCLIELQSHVPEVVHAGGTVFDDCADGLDIAESGTGIERIGDMLLEGIVCEGDAGDAALCEIGIAILRFAFCHNDHLAVRREVMRGGESGESGSDNQKIAVKDIHGKSFFSRSS